MSEEVLKRLGKALSNGGVENNPQNLTVEELLTRLEQHCARWSCNKTREEREVVLCLTCKGDGTLENKELRDYHKGEYDYSTNPCYSCGGSGRILITTRVL